jgi:chorismate mutase
MQKVDLKKLVIDKCIEIVKQRIELSKSVMKEAQKSANEYGGPKDRYDPFRNQQMSKKNMYAKQLTLAVDELEALEKIDIDDKFTLADFGAIVITNTQKLFISVGVGKMEINNDIFYAVSINSPIAQALIGKKINEKYMINGKEFTIQEIY